MYHNPSPYPYAISLCLPTPWECLREVMPHLSGTRATISWRGEEIELELREPGPSLHRAFRYGSQGTLSTATLRRIAQAQSVLYAHKPTTGGKTPLTMAQFAITLLQRGLPAIKVERSGVAWNAQTWQQQHENATDIASFAPHWLVFPVHDNEGTHTCGLHNFGYPDIGIEATQDTDLANLQLAMTLHYQLHHNAPLGDNHTLSLPYRAPVHPTNPATATFETLHTSYDGYDESSPHHNPYGILMIGRLGLRDRLFGTCEQAPLVQGLLSPQPAHREKALEALRTLNHPGPACQKAVGRLLEDPCLHIRHLTPECISHWPSPLLAAYLPRIERLLRHASLLHSMTLSALLEKLGQQGAACIEAAFAPASRPTNPLATYDPGCLLRGSTRKH